MKRDFFIKQCQLTKLFLVWSTILFSQIATWWTYPLKQVGVPQIECKGVHWSELPSECKIDLPIIKGANYAAYKNNNIYRAIYSDIWWSSYTDGWDNLAWWSPGIDIATPEWTPIYAIWDWEVIQSREIAWYGKSVTIKHIINGKAYYSSYSHMSKIEVNVWDKVKEWQKIWEVGKTWFTIWRWWYHLDFSISDAYMHTYPYGYVWCKAWYMSAVNDGACRNELFENTIDPIAFLEFQWSDSQISIFEKNIISMASKQLSTTVSEIKNTPVEEPKQISYIETVHASATNDPKRRIVSIPSIDTKIDKTAIVPTDDTEAISNKTIIQNTNNIVWQTNNIAWQDQDMSNQWLSPITNKEKKLAWSTEVTPMDLDYKLKLAKLKASAEISREPVRINVAKKVLDTSPAVWAWSKVNYATSEIPVFKDGNLEIKITWLYKKGGITWIKNQDTQIKVVINTIWVDGKKTPFDGKLSKPITFKSATSAIFAPYNYTIVENSYMIIHLSPIAVWTDSLWVYYGDKLLGTYKINIK